MATMLDEGRPFGSSLDHRLQLARRRRSQATSSDSSDAGEFSISKLWRRVGAPPPYPLPMDTRWDPPCQLISDEIGPGVLEMEAEKILEDENVKNVISVELWSRIHPDAETTSEGRPTILIVASWDKYLSSSLWEQAVRKLKKFVDSRRLTSNKIRHLDIAVEMIAEELWQIKYLSLVPAEILAMGLENDWESIKSSVSQILENHSSTKGHTTAIDIFRFGPSLRDSDNYNTVYISVDYESNEAEWSPAVEEIEHHLQRYQYAELRVHMEHNTVEPYTFPLVSSRRNKDERMWRQRLYNMLPRTPYKAAVNLGDDIGVSEYITASNGQKLSPALGTLGCWLEIKSTNFPDWTRVALTNYHIIRSGYGGFKASLTSGEPTIEAPQDNSALWGVDSNGVGRKPAAPSLEHPSRSKHNYGVQNARDLANGLPGELSRKYQAELDQMVGFFDQGRHMLGSVYCASGFTRRTANKGVLDWALVLPFGVARIGNNRLPSLESWVEKYPTEVHQYPVPETSENSLRQPPQAGLRGFKHGQKAYKVGASTGLTIGEFNRLKSGVTLADRKHVTRKSDEFAFLASAETEEGDDRFSAVGDSGSVVWNKQGQAVGLLFSGQKPQQTERGTITYVTPIEDVFEDIKAFSKGAITDIRIAED